MEDLLKTQIQESCRLALPNGLKELMSDISREVLRARPTNLNKFIADYLLVLFVTRENLSVAARICNNICCSACQPELEDKLIEIGLSEEDVVKATEIIEKYFYKDKLKESTLLMKLMRKTNVGESQLQLIKDAVRKAYLKHQANCKMYYELSDSDGDEVQDAVNHTLKLYRDTKPTEEQYNQMATKIQAAYRAYGVRRQKVLKCDETLTSLSQTTSPVSSKKSIRFGSHSVLQTEEIFVAAAHQSLLGVQSSSSLAGSYPNLPKPYSVHSPNTVSEHDESEQMLVEYNKEVPIIPSRLSRANIDKPFKGDTEALNMKCDIRKKNYKNIYNCTSQNTETEFQMSEKQVNDESEDETERKRTISFNYLPQEITDNMDCHEEELEECIKEYSMEGDDHVSDDGNEEIEIEEDIEENKSV